MSDRTSFLHAVQFYRPSRAIVLGSGIACGFSKYPVLAEANWAVWPGSIPMPHVAGHAGSLRIVESPSRTPVLLIGGRLHRYEGHTTAVTTQLVRQLPELGCTELILTCATGGIDQQFGPGSIALVTGWIDMALVTRCPQLDSFLNNSRLVTPVPDSTLKQMILAQANVEQEDFKLGIVVQMKGPTYETRAEIRMLRNWGASMVGMSSGHEWKAALGVGLDVQVLSLVTNWACGVMPGKIDHAAVVRESGAHATRLARLVMV
jgi:purine-nucleoside phosphorylase